MVDIKEKPITEIEFNEIFGSGAKYPIKWDSKEAWRVYGNLTAKQKPSMFKKVNIKLLCLKSKDITLIVQKLAKIDKVHMDLILNDDSENIKIKISCNNL